MTGYCAFFSSPCMNSVARLPSTWRSRLSLLLSLSCTCATSKLVRMILIAQTKSLLMFNVVMAIASTNTLNVIHSCRYWVLPFLLWVLLLFASSVAAVVILSVQASDNTDHIPCALISSKADPLYQQLTSDPSTADMAEASSGLFYPQFVRFHHGYPMHQPIYGHPNPYPLRQPGDHWWHRATNVGQLAMPPMTGQLAEWGKRSYEHKKAG